MDRGLQAMKWGMGGVSRVIHQLGNTSMSLHRFNLELRY